MREEKPESRLNRLIDKAEKTYLILLRAAVLGIATLLLAYALWLGLAGLYKISKSPDSVREAEAKVSAETVATLDNASVPDDSAPNATDDRTDRKPMLAFYRAFRKRYFDLYRQSFENYRHASDPQMSETDFDTAFLSTDKRQKAAANGNLDFEKDRADLEKLFATMKEAAALPITRKRLETYRKTQPRRVVRSVEKIRYERYCSFFSSYFDSCITYDTRPVPYTERQVSMAMPDGLLAPRKLFEAYQANFGRDLTAQRETNAAEARQQREAIVAGNMIGRMNLWTAMQIAAAFMMLMFFFLMIAIERHQRKLSDWIASRPKDANEPSGPKSPDLLEKEG